MRTGGRLNVINEKHRCNDPQKTIRVSSIMRVHRPRTEQAMVELLERHVQARCKECGEIARNGGVTGWVDALWRAAQADGANHDWNECQAFVYDLYVRAPVRGFYMEDCALAWLQQHGYSGRLATPHEDCAYAVDLIITAENRIYCGIQVKPISYRYTLHAHGINLQKNAAFGYPVFYLYYTDNEEWYDMGLDVLKTLWALIVPTRWF